MDKLKRAGALFAWEEMRMPDYDQISILREGAEAWNNWRADNPKMTPNLGIDNDYGESLYLFSMGGPSTVDFSEYNFRGGDFSGAKFFNDEEYKSISLRNVDLRKCNFRGAKFRETDLRGADLRGSDLSEAAFTDAQLEDANFAETLMSATLFDGVDLSRSRGLIDVVHEAPSIVSVDTLDRSAKGLSTDSTLLGEVEAFYRGAGVPEHLVEYYRSRNSSPIEFYSCFISYSHADRSFARRLHDRLQARGIRCWLDERQMLPGDDIYDAVDRGIRLWDKILLCCSRSSLMESWWVSDEIDKALEKERKLLKDRGRKILAIIPLNLDGYVFDWQDGRASTLRRRSAADFTGWETDNSKFEEQFIRVENALRADEAAREQAPVTRL